MIVVDTSVWINYFNGVRNQQTDWLHDSLGQFPIILGDIILMEILQGFRHDKDYRTAKRYLSNFPLMTMGGEELVIKSADNYRKLRKKGITVRKSVDVLIGTFCIQHHYRLLHDDIDFIPLEKHLHLLSVEVNRLD